MSLQNLLGISLDTIAPDKAQVAKLLAAAQRNIDDAQLDGLSAENRFDAAYKAIMQLAMLALNANGFRTLTSKPGHHQTAIQTLTLTMALPTQKVIVLDALRKQRNLADYSGDLVPDSAVLACLMGAKELHAHVVVWLAANKPELL
ncbi:DNA-binding protein [Aquabacterium sp.]|uniref:DNA-binding protein n=1 Tax=Aquabacterium sp. TaxID=1872578 RepID=UPI00198E4AF9|nr:DNA-binding protein [Aquabacterium sp.]MBC7699570.1 DNA-binding protein [Aquabacterium sp.]